MRREVKEQIKMRKVKGQRMKYEFGVEKRGKEGAEGNGRRVWQRNEGNLVCYCIVEARRLSATRPPPPVESHAPFPLLLLSLLQQKAP